MKERRKLIVLIALTILGLVISIFGGFLIGAIDPYFGFRLPDTPDNSYIDHSINVHAMNLGIDHIDYALLPGSHAGIGYSFIRKSKIIAGIGGEHPFYLGLLDINGDGKYEILTSGRVTGVWSIDTSGLPADYDFSLSHSYNNPDDYGALKRIPSTFKSKVVLKFANYLTNDLLIVPALSVLFLVEIGFLFEYRRQERSSEKRKTGKNL